MTYTLSEWWKRLDDEARQLAIKYKEHYPDALQAPYTSVLVRAAMTPLQAIHAMASLGIAIEDNVMSGKSIAQNIDIAAKNLGELLPGSTHYIPAITDEQSLLLAVIYYRSQCRFQDVESSSNTIQNGMMGIPGLSASKPGVAKEAEMLRNKIKDFCSKNQAIAHAAHQKFTELHPEKNAVGCDLFQPKSLDEQYTDFVGLLISDYIKSIQGKNHDALHKNTLDSTCKLKVELQKTQKELDHLYLLKKLNEFVAKTQEYSQMTLQRFMAYIDSDDEKTVERTDSAQKIWEAAQEHAERQKYSSEHLMEGFNYYTPGFLKRFTHARFNPLTYLPMVISLDEHARYNRFKDRFSSYITSAIITASTNLSTKTSMQIDDLKVAKAAEIHNVVHANHELIIEIERLKKSLGSYISEIEEDHLIQFSKFSFINWITEQLAQCELTRPLLHDNIHYLQIASDSMKQIAALEMEVKEGQSDCQSTEKLANIKESIKKRAYSVKESSRYLLFAEERNQAYKQITHVGNDSSEPVLHEQAINHGI